MRASLLFIIARFQQFNEAIFHGELPAIPLTVSNARTRAGSFTIRRRRGAGGRWLKPEYSIAISSRFDLPQQEIEDVLIHEMIHYYIALRGINDTSAHGPAFRRIMDDINRLHGRHITVATRLTAEMQQTDRTVRPRVVCAVRLRDGRRGITIVAAPRLRQTLADLPAHFPVDELHAYAVADPYFNRFPTQRSLKILLPADMTTIDDILARSREIVFDGPRAVLLPPRKP